MSAEFQYDGAIYCMFREMDQVTKKMETNMQAVQRQNRRLRFGIAGLTLTSFVLALGCGFACTSFDHIDRLNERIVELEVKTGSGMFKAASTTTPAKSPSNSEVAWRIIQLEN